MSVLTVDQSVVQRHGEHNVLRYAQAHDVQLVTVNYPLPATDMDALNDKIERWLTKQSQPAKTTQSSKATRKSKRK